MKVKEPTDDESGEEIDPERGNDLDVTYEFRPDNNRLDSNSNYESSASGHMTKIVKQSINSGSQVTESGVKSAPSIHYLTKSSSQPLASFAHMTEPEIQSDSDSGELLSPREDPAIEVKKPGYRWWSNYSKADDSEDDASDLELSARKARDLFTRHRRRSSVYNAL